MPTIELTPSHDSSEVVACIEFIRAFLMPAQTANYTTSITELAGYADNWSKAHQEFLGSIRARVKSITPDHMQTALKKMSFTVTDRNGVLYTNTRTEDIQAIITSLK